MTYDASLISYFLHASVVVKIVMLILLAASVFSWAYILERHHFVRKLKRVANDFEQQFWSGEELTKLYATHNLPVSRSGIRAIFCAGYQEFTRLRQQAAMPLEYLVSNIQRAMRAAETREQAKAEHRLPFLAIVGSTSPYVGLFGTVWGIMQAFRALANVQQATISMVAPGIAEALIATALGLFAAIPAVIAYNRYLTEIAQLNNRYNAFQEEFVNILVRHTVSHRTE